MKVTDFYHCLPSFVSKSNFNKMQNNHKYLHKNVLICNDVSSNCTTVSHSGRSLFPRAKEEKSSQNEVSEESTSLLVFITLNHSVYQAHILSSSDHILIPFTNVTIELTSLGALLILYFLFEAPGLLYLLMFLSIFYFLLEMR